LRYQLYRKVIRWKAVHKIASFLHPDLALTIGSRFSRTSRQRKDSQELVDKKSKGLKNYAKWLIEHKKADIVVLGHSHQPVWETMGNGSYLNCGDWITYYSYVEIDAGKPALKEYNIKNEQI